MDRHNNLMLIDSDTRRRAAICHTLAIGGKHVEPFEDMQEIAQHWPSTGVILVEDQNDNIPVLLDHMTAAGNWLPVIGFSEHPSTRRVVRAILEGAVDYLQWPCPADEIESMLTQADSNAASLSSAKQREARARSRVQHLTRREREVLAGVAEGLSNRQIGEKLSISPRTVEIHRANMLQKVGAQHTSEAIRVAIEAGLVE